MSGEETSGSAVTSSLNNWNNNPFDAGNDLDQQFKNKVHLRVQKRNNKKCVTIIEGLRDLEGPEIGDFLRRCRKVLCCNGNLEEAAGVIVLQGDHRVPLLNLLGKYYGVKGDQVVVHGY